VGEGAKILDGEWALMLIKIMNNFAAILTRLQGAIAVVSARERHLTVLLVAVWGRIGRIRARLERLIALWRAGMLPKPRLPGVAGARAVMRAPSIIPTHPGWLLGVVGEAGAVRGQLEMLLSEAECVAFLAAVPQAVRILRPLSRMLGIGVKPIKRCKPQPVWRVPRRLAPLEAPSGLVLGPGGRLIYV